MSRRYYEVTIRMIAEPNSKDDIKLMLRDTLVIDPPIDTIDACEVDILVRDLGDIKVNENGYAVSLPKLEDK